MNFGQIMSSFLQILKCISRLPINNAKVFFDAHDALDDCAEKVAETAKRGNRRVNLKTLVRILLVLLEILIQLIRFQKLDILEVCLDQVGCEHIDIVAADVYTTVYWFFSLNLKDIICGITTNIQSEQRIALLVISIVNLAQALCLLLRAPSLGNIEKHWL